MLIALQRALPPELAGLLRDPRVLCIPLRFKERLLGAILSALDEGAAVPSIPMAGALGSQIAVALANVALFETVRRHEKELSELTERQMQLREETLRDISRELHDGLGQSLTAISRCATASSGCAKRTGNDVPSRSMWARSVSIRSGRMGWKAGVVLTSIRPSSCRTWWMGTTARRILYWSSNIASTSSCEKPRCCWTNR